MLEEISIKGFKSLLDVRNVKLPPMAVLFGPNTAGKSNFIEAVQILSRIATSKTLSDALQSPIRGYPIEAFSFPPGGISELLDHISPTFRIEAILKVDKNKYAYNVEIRIEPKSGRLTLEDEYLSWIGRDNQIKSIIIEKKESKFKIRRTGVPARPREESIDLNYALISDQRYSGSLYPIIEKCRNEFNRWFTYYLEPLFPMRFESPPSEVYDIGLMGEKIAPFLLRLKVENPEYFASIVRTLKSIIPSIQNLNVNVNKVRGTIDVSIKQNGIEYSSRVISEGSLRIMALCCIGINPWSGSVYSFEEPENGVHPRRLELIARLLSAIAIERKKQIIITTHSPLFCGEVIKLQKEHPNEIGLFNVTTSEAGTHFEEFQKNTLFQDEEILEKLTSRNEDGIFTELLKRGLIDE